MGTTVVPHLGSQRRVMAPGKARLAFLSIACLLMGVILVLLANGAEGVDQPGLRAFLACWLTVPYVVAGLIAWCRRPQSGQGPLMVIAGFGIAVTFLNWSDNDLLYTIGFATQFLPPALLLHVFLAYPDGRLESPFERAVVYSAYGTAMLSVIRMLFGEEGERDLLAVTNQPDVYQSVRTTELIAMSALLTVGAGYLVYRRVRSGRPLRPAVGYLVDSFSVALVMLAVLYMVQAFGWTGITEGFRLTTFGLIGLAPVVFLAGLFQARLGRASVGELMVELGVNPGPAELEAAVVRCLRDPSARIAYWLPEFDAYADVDGRQIELGGTGGWSETPIVRNGVSVARLLHDPALDDERELVSSVAAAVGMTIENAQLQVDLRARLEELRGSRVRILEAEQRERQRLERDLHDGAQQRLISLSLELGELTTRLGDDPELKDRIETARREVTSSLSELRDLAHGIHPATVTDHGLAVALESLAIRAPVPVQVMGATRDRLPQRVELAVFYIVSEALANVARHARASSSVVDLTRTSSYLVVEVRDDGVGGATADDGTGLRGLADRVEALGGRLQVWSPAGRGTRLRAEIPCE